MDIRRGLKPTRLVVASLTGVDHKKLTLEYQGRHYRLTDVHGNVVKALLA